MTNKLKYKFSSLSSEHYTPPAIIEKVRQVLGRIDLDPASNSLAALTVKALNYYTEEENGYQQLWYGKVFLNPPGGRTKNNKSTQGDWIKKGIAHYRSGEVSEFLCLSFNIESFRICQDFLSGATICIPRKRLRYYSEYSPNQLKEGQWSANFTKWTNSPTHASIFYYFGHNTSGFRSAFQDLGIVFSL